MSSLSAHTISKQTSLKQTPSREWITDDLANVIIQAFKDGELKGKKKFMDDLVEKYKKEMTLAQDVYKEFFDVIRAAKIECRSIHLRVGSPFCFEAVFVIPAKDYFGDGFAKALELSKTFKHPSATITLNYRFMPWSKSINYAVLEADGFATTYGI